MDKKLSKAPDEGRSIKKLDLYSMPLFENVRDDKKKKWAEKIPAWKKRLMSLVRKQCEKMVEQGSKFNVRPPGDDSDRQAYGKVESTATNTAQFSCRGEGDNWSVPSLHTPP